MILKTGTQKHSQVHMVVAQEKPTIDHVQENSDESLIDMPSQTPPEGEPIKGRQKGAPSDPTERREKCRRSPLLLPSPRTVSSSLDSLATVSGSAD